MYDVNSAKIYTKNLMLERKQDQLRVLKRMERVWYNTLQKQIQTLDQRLFLCNVKDDKA